ncbi:SBDS family protein (plasmid) [Streptomyces sp. NBC_01426]|uniref:SBDS family protein n=1 Tax=Streptomyces sp. NBC_01426 TaxID=2975866 RepID=UPI002E322EF4|nr:SBDS family protein [Streptomyces sp. NBC_01426]
MTESKRVHYETNNDVDLFVMVNDADVHKKWLSDASLPLTEVVDSLTVYTTDNGVYGHLRPASKALAETELGTSDDYQQIAEILRNGTLLS